MPLNEDKILVLHLKQGNPKAFEQLFLRYQKKIYSFCKRILRSTEESENLVQTVFMEIWENRNRIDEEQSFSGYLFRITKNKIYNQIRKKINEQVYLNYLFENSENNTEQDYDIKQVFEIIDKLICNLPERRREIFLLSRNEGLTYKEIAIKLNITENTVDSQIRNTLDFLREEFRRVWK